MTKLKFKWKLIKNKIKFYYSINNIAINVTLINTPKHIKNTNVSSLNAKSIQIIKKINIFIYKNLNIWL